MSEQAQPASPLSRHGVPFRKIYENRTLRGISVGAVVVANVIKFFGSIETINKWVNSRINFRLSEFLYNNLRYIVIAVLLAGYTAAAYWVYKRYVSDGSTWKRIVEGAVLAIVVSAVFYLNVYMLPERPRVDVLIPEKTWAQAILNSQAPNGGIREQAGNPLIETQVWTTAQSLKALLASEKSLTDDQVAQVKRAFDYIEGARRTPDQKAPNSSENFEEGWGLFEFKRKSVTEIAAWVVLSYVASIDSKTRIWNDAELKTVGDRIERDLQYLTRRQEETGGWRPIEESNASYTRTYSTVMALWAFIEARKTPALRQRIGTRYDQSIAGGVKWLLDTYKKENDLVGWVPNPNRPGQRERFDGLTAQVLYVLSRVESESAFDFLRREQRYIDAKRDFLKKDEDLTKRFVCSNDRIHDFDLSFDRVDFTLEGSTLLWFPWSVAALTSLSEDPSLSPEEKGAAASLRQRLLQSKISDLNTFVESEFMYVLAENLFCLAGSRAPNSAPT